MNEAGYTGSGDYRKELAQAELRIAALEARLAEANKLLEELRGSGVGVPGDVSRRPATDTEKTLHILELRADALRLDNQLSSILNGGGR
jgi:hypothetical protein